MRTAASQRLPAGRRRESALRGTAKMLLVLCAVAIVGGCVRKPQLYEWGSYEEQVYATYSETGKVPVEQQIEELESDYQFARSENRPVPPGYHAYLGYLYYQAGKLDQSLQSFKTEKQLFPESTTYMDFLISRMTHT